MWTIIWFNILHNCVVLLWWTLLERFCERVSGNHMAVVLLSCVCVTGDYTFC